MAMINIFSPMKSQSISAVVTRADGTVEDLGIISYRHRNPLKHIAVNLFIYFKRKFLWPNRPNTTG